LLSKKNKKKDVGEGKGGGTRNKQRTTDSSVTKKPTRGKQPETGKEFSKVGEPSKRMKVLFEELGPEKKEKDGERPRSGGDMQSLGGIGGKEANKKER